MENLRIVKIGLYARVSSTKQAQEKTIDSQVASIIEYASSLGEKIEPDLQFIDDGVSGASLERPGLDHLRDKALAGEVVKVYVSSPDRLSRKSAHQILLIEEMKRLGVDFSFVNRNIGETPEDQMLLQIQGVVAEYEREKIIERSRRGKLYAAKNGKISVLSGAPYGYYYQKTNAEQSAAYLIHPEEALVVKEAFFLYCNKDFGLRQIAKYFTDKAYLTRTGKTFWGSSTISKMLHNPAYKGTAAFKKTKAVKSIKKTKRTKERKKGSYGGFSHKRTRPEEDWIYIPVPAIIEEKMFDIAQKRFQFNSKFSRRNNKKHYYLLSGLLRCKICGYSVSGRFSPSKYATKLYYRCNGQDGSRFHNGKVCMGHHVRAEALDDLVWESVRNLLLDPENLIKEYQRRLKSYKNDYEAVIAEKIREINRYKKEHGRLIDLFQSGLVKKEEITIRLKTVNTKLEQFDNEVRYLKNQDQESKKLLTIIRNLNDFSANISKSLDLHTFEEKRNIVRLLVEEVEVDSIKQEINVKHIIPLAPKNCQLRPSSVDGK
jgi:site-specific DNA recombinase